MATKTHYVLIAQRFDDCSVIASFDDCDVAESYLTKLRDLRDVLDGGGLLDCVDLRILTIPHNPLGLIVPKDLI